MTAYEYLKLHLGNKLLLEDVERAKHSFKIELKYIENDIKTINLSFNHYNLSTLKYYQTLYQNALAVLGN